MKRDYALYQVALKALMKKNGKILFLCLQEKGKPLDLPGGRIDNVEGKTPLEKILAREIKEELGAAVRYKLGSPLFQFRRYSPAQDKYNLLTVYEAQYIAGDIRLSQEHNSYEWLDPKTHTFKRGDFFNDEEYRAFKKYFNGLKKMNNK